MLFGSRLPPLMFLNLPPGKDLDVVPAVLCCRKKKKKKKKKEKKEKVNTA